MTTDVVFTLTVLMDSGLIGFIGVIAGALTTGGVQLIVEHQNRRNDALSAGRLVWGALADADVTITKAAATGTWGHVGDEPGIFERHLQVWESQRQALARASNRADFHIIAAAFATLHNMNDVIEDATTSGVADRGLSKIVNDPDCKTRIKLLNDAETAAMKAGSSLIDRAFEKRNMKRLEGWNGV